MSKIDWAELFGEEEGEEEDNNNKKGGESSKAFIPSAFEQVIPVNGLFFSPNHLSPSQQTSLLQILHNNSINLSSQRNQSVLFGLPLDLLNFIHNHILLPDYFFASRKIDSKSFDTAIVNFYSKGGGICPHVDLKRFDDGIMIISLLSPVLMHFERLGQVIELDLKVGSVLFMFGEARWEYTHCIKEVMYDELKVDGNIVRRERGEERVSITLSRKERSQSLI